MQSLDRINELEGEVHGLLSALRSVAVSDDFDSSKHRDIADLLSRVLSTYHVQRYESTDTFPIVCRRAGGQRLGTKQSVVDCGEQQQAAARDLQPY